MKHISLANPQMMYDTATRKSDGMQQLVSINIEEKCFYNFKLIGDDLYVDDIKLDQMDVLTSCGNIIIQCYN